MLCSRSPNTDPDIAIDVVDLDYHRSGPIEVVSEQIVTRLESNILIISVVVTKAHTTHILYGASRCLADTEVADPMSKSSVAGLQVRQASRFVENHRVLRRSRKLSSSI